MLQQVGLGLVTLELQREENFMAMSEWIYECIQLIYVVR